MTSEQISTDEWARIIVALRITSILSTRALMAQGGNYSWDDLDEEESNEVEKLLTWLDDDEQDDARQIRTILALGEDLGERDDLIGRLSMYLGQRLQDEGRL
jgi:hypothetical protein